MLSPYGKTGYGTTFCDLRHMPERPLRLQFRQSSDAPLRHVRRPCCLGDCCGRRIRTDITSHLDPQPADRFERYGCSLPATEFGPQRCPLVADPFFRNPGPDDIDAV